jgi:hypothetical protein
LIDATLRDRFRRDGVVFLPGALDARTQAMALAAWRWSIAHPSPRAARLYETVLERAPGAEAARALPSTEPGFFYQDLGNPDALSVYGQIIRRPAITRVLAALFDHGAGGSPQAWFTGEQVFLKEEGSPPTGWHQDISDMPAEGEDMAVIWMSFEAVPREGALEVVRGSHRGPVYSSIYGLYRSQPIPDVGSRRAEFDIVGFACRPGDIVVFHPAMLHGGGPTGPGARRRSTALRFYGEDCWFTPRARPRDGGPRQPCRRPEFARVL